MGKLFTLHSFLFLHTRYCVRIKRRWKWIAPKSMPSHSNIYNW